MKHNKLFLFSTLFFIIISFIISCKSPKVFLNEGNYDMAITKTIKKLRKNKTKEKHILVLEEAYAKANQRDLDRVNFLKKEGTAEGKVQVADIYTRIKARQDRVRPLMPLFITSEARDARFNFVDVDAELIQAKKDAAEFLYADAIRLLDQKERLPARQAYGNLMKIKNDYFNSFKDIDNQLLRARNLGTNKVIFKMVNGTGVPLPPDFEKELTKISLTHLNKEWLEYHTTFNSGYYYDYNIITNLKIIDVSPEIKDTDAKLVKKEVADGFEYKLDSKGNVMKDTAGNDIKIPKTKLVTCLLKTVYQRKVAHIEGSVDYLDNKTNQLVGTFPVAADAIFENRYATIGEGDVNILDQADKDMLKRQFIPYPNNFDLLLQAGRTLQPIVKAVIDQNQGLVKY